MFLFKNHKKELNNSAKNCTYSDIADCPYHTPASCKFKKDKCLHIKEKEKKRPDVAKLKLLIWLLSSLLIYVIVEILSNTVCFEYSCYVYRIVSSFSISIAVGVCLTFVIDLPTRLKDYEHSFIQALSSHSYIKTLDEQKLTVLRNDITEQLHKVSAPCMAKGLIAKDQKICELLQMPYYSRYRHSVICGEPDEAGFITKEHTIDYKLINPYGSLKEWTEVLQSTNLVRIEEGSTLEDVLEFIEFTCSIDEGEVENYLSKININHNFLEKQNDYYNAKVYLTTDISDTSRQQSNGIPISFKDSIQVHMRYKIKVCQEDRCFTKRLQHPVKNFRLDYSCTNKETKLLGQIFGTEVKQSDVSMTRSIGENTISLECFDWLLPQNGAIVVML